MAKETKKEGKNVLVGATGSVAAIKIPELVNKLIECPDSKVKSGQSHAIVELSLNQYKFSLSA